MLIILSFCLHQPWFSSLVAHFSHLDVHACCLRAQLPVCDPMGGSPPNSPLHGILQARILECVAMPSSRGSYRSRDQTCVSSLQAYSLPSEPPGSLSCRPVETSNNCNNNNDEEEAKETRRRKLVSIPRDCDLIGLGCGLSSEI